MIYVDTFVWCVFQHKILINCVSLLKALKWEHHLFLLFSFSLDFAEIFCVKFRVTKLYMILKDEAIYCCETRRFSTSINQMKIFDFLVEILFRDIFSVCWVERQKGRWKLESQSTDGITHHFEIIFHLINQSRTHFSVDFINTELMRNMKKVKKIEESMKNWRMNETETFLLASHSLEPFFAILHEISTRLNEIHEVFSVPIKILPFSSSLAFHSKTRKKWKKRIAMLKMEKHSFVMDFRHL